MKMRIGNRLSIAREDRKLNQIEMAELLGVSPSTYSRLERNETSLELEQIVNFSKTLQIPIQEFLPETLAIHHSNNENGQVGFIIGNFNNYANTNELVKDLEHQLALKNQENTFLKEQIENLKKINTLLEKK